MTFGTSLASLTTTLMYLTSETLIHFIVTVYSRIYGSVRPSTRAITLAVCSTESDLDYDVIHPSHDTYGICGIKAEIWYQIIPELNHTNINSLYAGSLVLDYLLKKHNYALVPTIKEYKGASRNFKPVHKVMRVYRSMHK